ncbi:MAG: type II secretion system protein [Paenibacillus sp. RIFOXYA1_FULL_44_5]|nr:MAG: type II secretion system protein [Paenibacillus sp. RIFOXYA1_FULL_44_5]
MKWIIILLFLFTSILIFTGFMQYFFLNNKRMEKRLKYYLELQDKKKLSRKKFNILVQLHLYRQSLRGKVSKKKSDKLEQRLTRAGIRMKPEEFILFQWISTFLLGGFFYLLIPSIFVIVLGVSVGYVFPLVLLNFKQKQRLTKFNDGLQDMITTIIGSLRAGFSFAQALKTVVDEADAPIQDEMEWVLKDMQYGTSIEDALNDLKERMPSEDLDLFIQAILIQRQVGGNLAVVLETIVQTIRDRNKIQRQIRTLTAQGRLSGIVIGLLPLVLGVVLYMIQPGYIGSLFQDPIGLMMLGAGGFSGIIVFIMIRKMTRIEV